MIYTSTKDVLIYIKQQMLARGITIKDLADKMDLTQSAVGQKLRQKNITLDSLNDICKALDYQIEINIIDSNKNSTIE